MNNLKVFHNSWLNNFKSPIGAFDFRSECSIRLFVDLSIKIHSIFINLHDEKHICSSYNRNLVLECTENNFNIYSIKLSFNDVGFVYYNFTLNYELDENVIEVYAVHNYDNEARIEFNKDFIACKWQISLYNTEKVKTPDILKKINTMYCIHPDRFCKVGKVNEEVIEGRVYHSSFDEEVVYLPNEKGIVENNDFFGGNISGIISRLDYLESLGVNAIYHLPILKSLTNHRYDTLDYKEVDPLLGTIEDYKRLCDEAHKRNMIIVFDGVFDHVSSKSKYSNLFWYVNGKRLNWWNDESLAQLDLKREEVQELICDVLRYWKNIGVDVLRIDVADEFPNELLERMNEIMGVVIGEVWEDATTKFDSKYGTGRREFFNNGDKLNSLMNYPFRKAIIEYVRYKNSEFFKEQINHILDHYPKEVNCVLMNFLSTHDRERILTKLVAKEMPDFENVYRVSGSKIAEVQKRQWEYDNDKLSGEQLKLGIKLEKIAYIIAAFLPGFPCIFYGDEVGLTGYIDPFCRKPYPYGKENLELLEFYKSIGNLLKENSFIKEASFSIKECTDNFLYMEYKSNNENLVVMLNNSPKVIKISEDKIKEISLYNLEYSLEDSTKIILNPYGAAILKYVKI